MIKQVKRSSILQGCTKKDNFIHFEIFLMLVIIFIIVIFTISNIYLIDLFFYEYQISGINCDIPLKGQSRLLELKPGDAKHHVFIYLLRNNHNKHYTAICGGSVIGFNQVLTSAHCLLTCGKRLRYEKSDLKVAAGALKTDVINPVDIDKEQWRDIKTVKAQRYFRYPKFNIGVITVTPDFKLNDNIQPIWMASIDKEYDGYCSALVVKAKSSLAAKKYLFAAEVTMISKSDCTEETLRSCKHFHPSKFQDLHEINAKYIEGSGLVCFETSDPQEEDNSKGILVGVASMNYINKIIFHTTIARYRQWIHLDL